MAAERTNVSSDLIWQITRSQNAFLVKRRTAGGSQFSRDPLNLQNKQSFKYAGYANTKAVGVQATENGGVILITKKSGNAQQPAKNLTSVSWGPNAATRKIYKVVADKTAKNGYRADLREDVVARVSAIRRSQKPKKDSPAKKLRGAQAKKAAEQQSE
ncbi:60S ribosomal protein L28 [Aspergillus clavatus NRRL 1]|uniref:60S ribosomal protein L28 n=1 Tax=Aspergillus clavatus (strain ATCC 1007 / CBS 513.65 / DSM 816 / NCTC 3887 / NRRL 1 / QM 1276 / 107) TaxID=344612 RepID=A1CM13_ASPCL|nr:60S ribosomal protein L28 [Aspergillus clavatus NRRL 1]EAW08600.1 60S ribosomal protein L28 [Aspergillus clavatus NRRL 1]